MEGEEVAHTCLGCSLTWPKVDPNFMRFTCVECGGSYCYKCCCHFCSICNDCEEVICNEHSYWLDHPERKEPIGLPSEAGLDKIKAWEEVRRLQFTICNL